MNIFAAIDLETTGLAPGWNDVLEIAIVPLTQDFTIDTNVTEFSCRIRAEHPDRIDPKAVAVNNLNPAEGKPLQEVEADLISWAEENGISVITPIAHNLAFDMAFMKAAFPVFSRIFSHHGRDSMRLALSLNDILRTQIGEEPFSSVSLQSLKLMLDIDGDVQHTAILDSSETYMVEPGLGTKSGATGALLLAQEAYAG